MGQECYTGRPVPDRDGKLDRAADRSIFCGMAPDFKGWITYCIRTRLFDASVDVRFPPASTILMPGAAGPMFVSQLQRFAADYSLRSFVMFLLTLQLVYIHK